MNEELKPCPFCGHKTIQESFFDLPCKVYRIRCPRCYIFMDNISENMVMKAWNTRPIEDDLRKQLYPFQDAYFKGLTMEQIAEIAKKSIRLTTQHCNDMEQIEKLIYEVGEAKERIAELENRKIWHAPEEVPERHSLVYIVTSDFSGTDVFYSCDDGIWCMGNESFIAEDIIKWAYVSKLEEMK